MRKKCLKSVKKSSHKSTTGIPVITPGLQIRDNALFLWWIAGGSSSRGRALTVTVENSSNLLLKRLEGWR